MARAFIRMIDAGFSGDGGGRSPIPGTRAVELFPSSGEYAVAIRRLSELGREGPAGPSVPDEVFLHLFACEALERMRERAGMEETEAEVLVVPFWPVCLFEAAGLATHAVREVESLFPTAEETRYAVCTVSTMIEEAERVLGQLRFDPGAYLEALESMAAREGWTRHDGT
jgi:hypothetical protein